MDPSRFRRRETQIIRQNNKNGLGSGSIEGFQTSSARPHNTSPAPMRPAVVQTVSQPKLQPMLRPQTRPVPVVAQTSPVMERKTLAALAVQGAIESLNSAPQLTQPEAPTQRRRGGIDMGLPGGEETHWAAQMVVKKRFWPRFRRFAFRLAIVFIIAILGIGGLLASQGFLKLHKVFKGTTGTAAALKSNVAPDLLKSEGDGRINVLLLGRGGGDHDGPDLTDTMMLASIDPVGHTEVLVSIPRDLWVQVNSSAMKINAAWETGEFNYEGKIAPGSTDPKAIEAGFKLADKTVESVLGVNIDYNVIVDFSAFQQAVDTVGGVTVNVPSDLIDPTMAWENNNNPVLAKAGIQTFNGHQALTYVRSRETTSDFARAQRQRAVLLALKSKVDTLGTLSNPLKISNLISAFGNNVATDISLSDATSLYGVVKGISDANTTSIGFADEPNSLVTTAPVGNQSTVQPKAGMFNYTDIQNFIKGQLKDGYLLKENAKVVVLNGTTVPGLATAKANELKTYGYNVVGVGSTPSSGWTQTTLVDLSKGVDKYTRHYLEDRFNTTALTSLPDSNIQANGADFVIIIGSDEATTP